MSLTLNGLAKLLDTAQTYDKLADLLLTSPPNDPRPILPLRNFQKAILRCMSRYDNAFVQAPSQAGKSTALAIFVILRAILQPNSNHIVVSATESSAEEFMRKLKEAILPKFIFTEIRRTEKTTDTYVFGYKVRTTAQEVQFGHNSSIIRIIPNSVRQLAGNDADTVILDEMARWDESSSHLLYAEAEARTGNTLGKILCVSTFLGSGEHDNTKEYNFAGNFYHYLHQAKYHQCNRPNLGRLTKSTPISLSFTHSVSERLTATIRERTKNAVNRAYIKEHYFGIARKVAGTPVFEHHFEPKTHIATSDELLSRFSRKDPILVSIDPGNLSAAVIAQHNLDTNQLTVYHTTMTQNNETFPEFLTRVNNYVKQHFQGFPVQPIMDIAGSQRSKYTGSNDLDLASEVFNSYPLAFAQQIRPGIDLVKMLLDKRNALKISPSCTTLIDALRTGIVYEDNPRTAEAAVYKKDGFYDHCIAYNTPIKTSLGDIPIQNVTKGMQVLTHNGFKTILKAQRTQMDAVLTTVETSSNTLRCTSEHTIPTQRGDILVKNLTPNDWVYELESDIVCNHLEKAIQSLNTLVFCGDAMSYTQIEAHVSTTNTTLQQALNTCIDSYMKTRMVLSLKDGMSIILMGILTIIVRLTLKLFALKTMHNTTKTPFVKTPSSFNGDKTI